MQRALEIIAVAAVFAVLSVATPQGFAQQQVIVRGTAGVVQQDIKNNAAAMSDAFEKRNSLALERRENIERLTRELTRCGNCPDRQNLADELRVWQMREAVISFAESEALKAMGLGKYGDMRGLKAAWADYIEHYNLKSQAEKDRDAFNGAFNAAQGYCGELSYAAREKGPVASQPIRSKCLAENEANDMVLQEKIGLSYCSKMAQSATSLSKMARRLYMEDCIVWNVPRRRLALLWERMRGVPFDNKQEKQLVGDWCSHVGVKDSELPGSTDPVTGRNDRERAAARNAAWKQCKDHYAIADLVRQRDEAERACVRSPNDFDRRSLDVFACLMTRDPVTRMNLEMSEAREAVLDERRERDLKKLQQLRATQRQ